MSLRTVLLVAATLLLSACGFHLRGHDQQGKEFAFRSIYLKVPVESSLAKELRLQLALNEIPLSNSSSQADLTLEIVSEANDKQILALSGAGQIREYQLRYRVSLRAYDLQQNDWMSPDEIMLIRNQQFSDAQILAKEEEELIIKRDMITDAAQQILRRLSRAKPRPVEASPQP